MARVMVDWLLRISAGALTGVQELGERLAVDSRAKPGESGQEMRMVGPDKVIWSLGGGSSASRMPLALRSSAMRLPEPGGTPISVSVSPAWTLAAIWTRVSEGMLAESTW